MHRSRDNQAVCAWHVCMYMCMCMYMYMCTWHVHVYVHVHVHVACVHVACAYGCIDVRTVVSVP